MTAAITDFSHFAGLRRDAAGNDPAALREIAGQFEALFLQSMLKSMRDASFGDPLFGDSNAHDTYRDMLDKQFALEMSSGRGIGLADMIVRQLGGSDAARTAGTSETVTAAAPAFESAESFAREVWPHAERVGRELGVAPEGLLAQAALETGWGRHVIPRADGETSFNLFGIKANGGWQGDSVQRRTLEFEDGIPRRQTAEFRAYKSVADTFDDYAALMTTNPRYRDVQNQGDVDGFAAALQSSGYATDPDYAAKISRVADSETMARVLDGLKNGGAQPITR